MLTSGRHIRGVALGGHVETSPEWRDAQGLAARMSVAPSTRVRARPMGVGSDISRVGHRVIVDLIGDRSGDVPVPRGVEDEGAALASPGAGSSQRSWRSAGRFAQLLRAAESISPT